jgi:hypothetical protein
MGSFAETVNVDYRLSFADREKQTSFHVFHYRKQTEVWCFRFLFAANIRKLSFSVFLYWDGSRYIYLYFLYIDLYNIYQYIYLYLYIYLCKYIYIYIYVCYLFKQKTKNGIPGDFPFSFYRLLIVEKEVCVGLFTPNESYPFVDGLNRLAHLC